MARDVPLQALSLDVRLDVYMSHLICPTHGTPMFVDNNLNAWCPDCLKSAYSPTQGVLTQYHHDRLASNNSNLPI